MYIVGLSAADWNVLWISKLSGLIACLSPSYIHLEKAKASSKRATQPTRTKELTLIWIASFSPSFLENWRRSKTCNFWPEEFLVSNSLQWWSLKKLKFTSSFLKSFISWSSWAGNDIRGHTFMTSTRKSGFYPLTLCTCVHMRLALPLWTSTCSRHEIHNYTSLSWNKSNQSSIIWC